MFSSSNVFGYFNIIKICETCRNSGELSKRETPCPAGQCQQIWKKTQISSKSREKLEYERQQEARLTLLEELNLTRKDFQYSPDYRNFEELVAEILFCINTKKNLEWAKTQVEFHKKSYREAIARNSTQQVECNLKLSKKIKEIEDSDIKALQDIETKEENSLLLKELDDKESNLVKLGELQETTMSKKKREDLTSKRKFQMKAYEGRNKHLSIQSQGSLFWKHAAALQPQPVDKKKQEKGDDDKFIVNGATGYNRQIVTIKNRQLLSRLNMSI